MRRLAIVWTLGLLLAGCPRPAAPPPRLQVRIVEVTAADGTPEGAIPLPPDPGGAGVLTDEALRDACIAGLRTAGVEVALGAQPPRRGDFRLDLGVRLEHVAPSADTDQRGLYRAMVHGRLQAVKAGEGSGPEVEIRRFDQDALAEKVYKGKAPTAAEWAAHGRRAAQDTATALGSQVALLSADRRTLLQTLTRKDLDADLRGVAIQLAGLRKEREALPALIAVVKDTEGEADLRDKAIGALIEIGDRAAVKPLAASAAFHNTYELGKILEAVASLGGEEARSYLSFVAAGHSDEKIRAEAKVALSHLEQREQRDKEASLKAR